MTADDIPTAMPVAYEAEPLFDAWPVLQTLGSVAIVVGVCRLIAFGSIMLFLIGRPIAITSVFTSPMTVLNLIVPLTGVISLSAGLALVGRKIAGRTLLMVSERIAFLVYLILFGFNFVSTFRLSTMMLPFIADRMAPLFFPLLVVLLLRKRVLPNP